MRIAQKEIFGPVVTITTFDREDEALAICNESEYGLMSAVYTSDAQRLFRVARTIEAGMVMANTYNQGTSDRVAPQVLVRLLRKVGQVRSGQALERHAQRGAFSHSAADSLAQRDRQVSSQKLWPCRQALS